MFGGESSSLIYYQGVITKSYKKLASTNTSNENIISTLSTFFGFALTKITKKSHKN